MSSKSSSDTPAGNRAPAGRAAPDRGSASAAGGVSSPTDREVVLARLGRPRGLKGEIWLRLETDRPEDVLAPPGPFRLRDGRTVRVEELRAVGDGWTWVLEGRPAREEVARYTNGVVVARASELPFRPEGELAEHEILGLHVLDESGEPLGTVIRVEHRYEIPTWILETVSLTEAEVPAVNEFLLDVDLVRRIAKVKRSGVWETEA